MIHTDHDVFRGDIRASKVWRKVQNSKGHLRMGLKWGKMKAVQWDSWMVGKRADCLVHLMVDEMVFLG